MNDINLRELSNKISCDQMTQLAIQERDTFFEKFKSVFINNIKVPCTPEEQAALALQESDIILQKDLLDRKNNKQGVHFNKSEGTWNTFFDTTYTNDFIFSEPTKSKSKF